MKRDIIKIDEELCNGCGLCIPNCHEGALQMIDGKARLISDLMCDGLGACIGHCPQGAITIEKREAEAYNEVAVMKEMTGKGKNTVVAHLKHLKDHQQEEFFQLGIDTLKEMNGSTDFTLREVLDAVEEKPLACGCPGSAAREIQPEASSPGPEARLATDTPSPSQLKNWPVQLHLLNPNAPYLQEADLLLAADCVAFSLGDFHSKWLKGKTLAIACPKLDSGLDSYLEKLIAMIDQARVNTLTVMIMEVP